MILMSICSSQQHVSFTVYIEQHQQLNIWLYKCRISSFHLENTFLFFINLKKVTLEPKNNKCRNVAQVVKFNMSSKVHAKDILLRERYTI